MNKILSSTPFPKERGLGWETKKEYREVKKFSM